MLLVALPIGRSRWTRTLDLGPILAHVGRTVSRTSTGQNGRAWWWLQCGQTDHSIFGLSQSISLGKPMPFGMSPLFSSLAANVRFNAVVIKGRNCKHMICADCHSKLVTATNSSTCPFCRQDFYTYEKKQTIPIRHRGVVLEVRFSRIAQVIDKVIDSDCTHLRLPIETKRQSGKYKSMACFLVFSRFLHIFAFSSCDIVCEYGILHRIFVSKCQVITATWKHRFRELETISYTIHTPPSRSCLGEKTRY